MSKADPTGEGTELIILPLLLAGWITSFKLPSSSVLVS